MLIIIENKNCEHDHHRRRFSLQYKKLWKGYCNNFILLQQQVRQSQTYTQRAKVTLTLCYIKWNHSNNHQERSDVNVNIVCFVERISNTLFSFFPTYKVLVDFTLRFYKIYCKMRYVYNTMHVWNVRFHGKYVYWLVWHS